jgi:hypothetical protein
VTRRSFYKAFRNVVIFFASMILVGVALSCWDPSQDRHYFSTFKDLIPFMIAIPAAWLSYFVQRRSAYLQQLRSLWSKVVDAVHAAIEYTNMHKPEQKDHANSIMKINVVIDEIRGVFCNLDETDENVGLYPFEPIKDIQAQIKELGWGEQFDEEKAKASNRRIWALWKDVRRELLKEFDREVPTFPHSHWVDLRKQGIYEKDQIPKTRS